MKTSPLTLTIRWLLVVSVVLVPCIFDPLDPGKSLLTAKMRAVWAVGLLAALLSLARLLVDRDRSPRPSLALALPFVAMAVALGLATWRAVSPHVSLWGSALRGEGLLTVVSYLVVAFVTAHEFGESQEFQRRWLAALVIGAAVNAGYALVQYLGLDPVWGYQSYLRPFGMQGNAAFLAGYLAMVSLVAIGAASEATRRLDRAVWLAGAAVLYMGILVTGSRAAWAGFWISWAALVVIVSKRGSRAMRRPLYLAGAMAAVLTTLYLLPASPVARTIDETTLQRVMADGARLRLVADAPHPDARPGGQRLAMTFTYDGGVPVRMFIWRGAVQSWFRSPLIGHGLDSFRYFPNLEDAREGRLYKGRQVPAFFHYNRVHNEFLEVAVASGLLGIAAFVWLLAGLTLPSLRVGMSTGDPIVLAVLGGALAFLLVLQVQPGYLGSTFVFWSVLGFAATRARWAAERVPGGRGTAPGA